MLLGIKKVTTSHTRPLGFSMFFAMQTFGIFIAGPLVDYFRSDDFSGITISYNGKDIVFSSYRLIFAIGAFVSMISFFVCLIFYREQDWDTSSDAGGSDIIVDN
jgi:MFS family permease